MDFLEQVVLGEIRRLTKFASRYEAMFAEAVMGYSQKNAVSDRQAIQRELYALQARDRELNTLFEKIYEDNVSGKLSDERFARMGQKYEDEQKELADKIKATKAALEKSTSQAVTAGIFISIVRKYTRAKKLTPRMLNELMEKIEVHQAGKVNGVWEKRLTIHYSCIGAITSEHNSRKLNVFPRPAGGGIHRYLFLLFLKEIISTSPMYSRRLVPKLPSTPGKAWSWLMFRTRW